MSQIWSHARGLWTSRLTEEFELAADLVLILFLGKSHQAMVMKSSAALVTSELPPAQGCMVKLLQSGGTDAELNQLKARLQGLGYLVQNAVQRSAPIHGHLNLQEGVLRVERRLEPVAQRRQKVLIVDDSKTIRDLLHRIISQDEALEVVGQAEDPREVEGLIDRLKPDVITLDIHMPHMDGVQLLEKYMARNPVPTIMISSITMDEGPQVLRALELGAFDYIQKPSFKELPVVAPMIIEKLKMAALSRRGRERSVSNGQRLKWITRPESNAILLLGASTGGTEALKNVLLRLPETIPPTLIVQHIPPVFSKAFADRLNLMNPFEVAEAKHGDVLKPNKVLVAPGGFQMELIKAGGEFKVGVVEGPPVSGHKPSVDHLFHSAAKFAKERRFVAGILTGMGSDGAYGLLSLLQNGAKTFAQDEATSVVYGMPRVAAKVGAAERVVPLDGMADLIVNWFSSPAQALKRVE